MCRETNKSNQILTVETISVDIIVNVVLNLVEIKFS